MLTKQEASSAVWKASTSTRLVCEQGGKERAASGVPVDGSSPQWPVLGDLLAEDHLGLGRALLCPVNICHTPPECLRALVDLDGNASGRIDGREGLAALSDEISHALLLDHFRARREVRRAPRDLASRPDGLQPCSLDLLRAEDRSCEGLGRSLWNTKAIHRNIHPGRPHRPLCTRRRRRPAWLRDDCLGDRQIRCWRRCRRRRWNLIIIPTATTPPSCWAAAAALPPALASAATPADWARSLHGGRPGRRRLWRSLRKVGLRLPGRGFRKPQLDWRLHARPMVGRRPAATAASCLPFVTASSTASVAVVLVEGHRRCCRLGRRSISGRIARGLCDLRRCLEESGCRRGGGSFAGGCAGGVL
mmetsp:Transcript_55841/g.141408  ORF Transcript_55841/g.141408 Transcript_55841/m.141408 type:complete len:362 (+) Transcript_55841:104-1189(+)